MIAAWFCVVVVGILTNVYLFNLFRRTPNVDSPKEAGHWEEKWEFSTRALGGFSWWQLALWSFVSLFLELLMIRWISSEIRVFAYFKNFVLIACFLGFGLGCYLSRRRVSMLPMFLPLLSLAMIIKLPWQGLRTLMIEVPVFVGASSEVQVWGVPTLPLDAPSFLLLIAAIAVIVPIFGLISFVFIPVGQVVGWYLENASNGILAYSVNVIASLMGIIFTPCFAFCTCLRRFGFFWPDC